uniref:Alpha-galactosidase n=1 Tax=Acrobeloides nanus TaxID=290746 RepID=A0A914EKP6_9BILA
MAQALNKTGKPIVYSCSWPAYLVDQPDKVNYAQIGQSCNLWRNFVPDIRANWSYISDIIDYYTDNQDKLIAANGPGHWNDPDMIVVGDPGLTPDQARAQMTMWSIWSAPLIMSNDLRNIDPTSKEILLNKRVISVDQDPLGIMGRLVLKGSLTNTYVKKMTPCNNALGICSYAVAILNKSAKLPVTASLKFDNIGLTYQFGYNVLELWKGYDVGIRYPNDTYNAVVPPTGVYFFKATPTIFGKENENTEKKLNEFKKIA